MAKESTITLKVQLNESGGPEAIDWQAEDATGPQQKPAEALLLSLWDAEAKQALRIDLWTPRMTVEEMNAFYYQTLMTMADTYKNATSNETLMAEIKLFAKRFAEKASASSD